MDSFENKLELLADALEKKHGFLEQILTITENQETILLSEWELAKDEVIALDGMFHKMNEEKQKLIDMLISSDRFFDKVFKEMSEEFEVRAEEFKPQVARLQRLITDVTDLDVKIRLQEQKNRNSIKDVDPSTNPKLVKGKVDFTKASKSYMLKQYKKNNEKDEE